MRKYPVKLDDGTICDMHSIGLNHTANGLMFGGCISAYNKEFDDEDIVNIENGMDDIRRATIGDIKEAYQLLKEELYYKDPRNIEDYAECIQKAVINYFGDFSNVEKRLSFFPDEESIDRGEKMGQVADLAHKNAAMCVERAMLAQNLLIELGINSTFKISGVIINGNMEVHAYNLVKYNGKDYVFDVTIPTIRNYKTSPIICEIPQEVYDKMISPNSGIGYSVNVSHFNPLQNKDYEITYDAGRNEIYNYSEGMTK